MALYVYRCTNLECAEESEMRHPIDQQPLIVCESCGEQCERIITAGAGIVWKCTGGTRAFKSNNLPRLPDKNLGHEDLTLGELGLRNSDAEQLGI